MVRLKESITKEWLKNHNFIYNKELSDEESSVYSFRFPVIKYGKQIVLEGIINIGTVTLEITKDVYDTNNKCDYVPFYNNEYGDYSTILNRINKKFKQELKKLRIEEDKDGNN